MKHPSAHARTHPDKIAYLMAETGDSLSFAQLDDLSNRGAQAFRALGLGQGDHIALLFENSLDFVGLTWAAQRAGLFYTAVSRHLSPDEIAYIVGDCDAKVMILSAKYADCLGTLEAACSDVRFFVCGAGAPAGQDWLAYQAAQPATPIADEAAGADLLYSSGTTGRPKGITRSFTPQPIDTVIPGLMTVLCETMAGMDADTIYLSPAPLYHAAPLRTSMMAVMLGGTAIIMERFDAEEMLRLIEAHKVTHTQVVPTMFVRMLKLPEDVRAKYDVSTLQVAFHAAAPCPKDVKAAMIDWWGPILIEYYAGSEANGVTVTTSEDWVKYPGTVGKSMIGRIVVTDPDGNELPVGEIGNVYFDSGVEFQYRHDPEKTAKAYLRPGCSTIGDVGYVNADGFLFLTDRASYTIISGGVNIYPQETENLLVTHPDVADVAVFGVPCEEMGEEVKAVVQLEPGVPATPEKAQELIDWCRARLSKIKSPKSVDFRDELPRTPTGKLIKRKLKDEYWPAKPAA
ncbi:acyl-CoA synthetase [Pseudooceanicola nitratireducens]|uniref:acyl-CoA synthetase n=1 Tax=Pseudooceanicola nitratireducens TaxID=517719 RepID=UPI001C9754B3|nr:acyl-CoA synthetase [Pseudooceanicola nitratireducens]MBY6159116.1 acyl-CoA synthetase [Pseudooceanicola nitratireducens]